jgi:hypothetical protein
MSHKFGTNALNLVLMPKKIVVEAYFFLNHVLRKTRRTLGEPTGRTPSIFLFILLYTFLIGKNIKKPPQTISRLQYIQNVQKVIK